MVAASRTTRHSLDARFYLAEALGTAILVLIGPSAAMVAVSTHAFAHEGVALAFGLVILLVAALGPISGAHLNPAVTLAFWSVNRFPFRHVLPYILAQCVGAIAASITLRWLLGAVANYGATVPVLDVTRAFAVEAGYSGILAFVIFAVATDERVSRSVVPFVIGLTVFAGALVTGPFNGWKFQSGALARPCRRWKYWIAPIVGMMIAARVHEFLRGATPPAAVPHGVPVGVEGPIS